MKPFIFSAESHVAEPFDLFTIGLPASLKKHALTSRREGDFLVAGTEEKTIYKMRMGNHRESPLAKDRAGLRDLAGRLGDMEHEGIDAEICFPTLSLWLYAIGDADAEAASARLYNDWHIEFLGSNPERSPTLGQHNSEILKRLLGLSDDELAKLEADAIIGTEPRMSTAW